MDATTNDQHQKEHRQKKIHPRVSCSTAYPEFDYISDAIARCSVQRRLSRIAKASACYSKLALTRIANGDGSPRSDFVL
jgi:hypothetical protein